MSEISLEENGRVLTIFINRENKLNPLNMETIEEIGEALKDESKIAVISGNNKAFSAGADIKVFLNLDPKTGFDFAKRGHDVMNFIQERRMPVIAAIHGFALGGGFELAMSCDLRISHPEAIFGLPEVTLGIIPGFGGTQRLRTLVGEGKAFQMASLGLKIKADEALKLGIVNELNEKYLERALELAKIYESLPYESVAYIKELIRGNHGNSYDREKEYFGNIFRTDNQKEGAKSFIEKRKPNFNKNIKKDL